MPPELRPNRGVLMLAAGAAASLIPALSPANDLPVDGFVQSHVAVRTNRSGCAAGTECAYPWSELRAQLRAEGKSRSGATAFGARLDLLHDVVLDDTSIKTRELYADSVSEKASLRAGRQVITWGVGDLLFINDTFPKDWVAMFTGQPMQYLNLPTHPPNFHPSTSPPTASP